MRTLGDVLVAMVTCGDRWPSIHAELVHRYDPGTAADARRALRAREGDRPADQPGPPASGAETGTGIADGAGTADGGGAAGPLVAAVAFVPAPAAPASGEEATDPVVRRGRLLAAAGLLRVEWPDEDEVTVVNGEHCRRRRGEAVSGTGTVGAAPPGTGPDGAPDLAWAGRRLGMVVREQILVQPWLLLSWVRLRLVAPIEAGGRPSTRLTAVPRPGPRPPAWTGLIEGAQRFEVVMDDETGVIVELAAFFRGRLVERMALRRLTLGDVADPRLFDLAALELGVARDGPPPLAPGEPPRAPGSVSTRPAAPAGTGAVSLPPGAKPLGTPEPAGSARPRPLVELAGEVDFALCVPVGRAFVGRIERRPEGVVVVAFPAANNGELLTVSQSAGAGIADTAGWERIRLPDGTSASWWPPDGDLLQGHLVFDRAGTRVWVRGVDRHAMTALALSLHPAR